MSTRGKKSAASFSVVSTMPLGTQRPKPGKDLTTKQAAVWRAVVSACPPDWFPKETHGELSNYCRHTVSAREIDGMIEAIKVSLEDPIEIMKALDKLFKMRERESRAASSLATRLRITNQALTNHKKNRENTVAKKPWEM